MKKYMHWILLVSILFNLTGGIFYFYKKASRVHVYVSPSYKNIQSFFDTMSIDSSNIVFIGDSLIANCELNELFKDTKIINRGISGDTTEGVLKRIEKISNSNPHKIFLLVGINDMYFKIDKKTMVSNYEDIIKNVKISKSILYIISILPIDKSKYNTPTDNNCISSLNHEIELISNKYKVIYINLYDEFFDGLKLKDCMSYDGLHLNSEGYRIFKKLIKKYI